MKITVTKTTKLPQFNEKIKKLGKLAAYVGVPATTSKERRADLMRMADAKPGKRGAKLAKKAAKTDINNAELLFVFSKGSPMRNQPPRPVLEPAVEANSKKLGREIAASVSAQLQGDNNKAVKFMYRAALAGQNAARSWFTDARNSWAPNAPSTIKAKGSERPGIDTGEMRNAIVGVVEEEKS
jgi:hypothetical protein